MRKGDDLCLQAGVPCSLSQSLVISELLVIRSQAGKLPHLTAIQGTGTVEMWQTAGPCIHVSRWSPLLGCSRETTECSQSLKATALPRRVISGGLTLRCSASTTAVSWKGCSLRTQPQQRGDAVPETSPEMSSLFGHVCHSHKEHCST